MESSEAGEGDTVLVVSGTSSGGGVRGGNGGSSSSASMSAFSRLRVPVIFFLVVLGLLILTFMASRGFFGFPHGKGLQFGFVLAFVFLLLLLSVSAKVCAMVGLDMLMPTTEVAPSSGRSTQGNSTEMETMTSRAVPATNTRGIHNRKPQCNPLLILVLFPVGFNGYWC